MMRSKAREPEIWIMHDSVGMSSYAEGKDVGHFNGRRTL